MNRVFRIVWSTALNTWVVASELTGRHGKGRGRAAAAMTDDRPATRNASGALALRLGLRCLAGPALLLLLGFRGRGRSADRLLARLHRPGHPGRLRGRGRFAALPVTVVGAVPRGLRAARFRAVADRPRRFACYATSMD